MKAISTRSYLAVAAVATLALIYLAPGEDASVSAPAGDKGRRSRPAATSRPAVSAKAAAASEAALNAKPGELASAERVPAAESIPDLFAATSWYVPPPPPPPPPPAAPPPPSAPPLPFAYLGQYIEGKTQLIILTRGDRMLNVSTGEVIDRIYQVGSLKGGQLTFTYLPLNIEQTLNTGIAQ